MLDNLEFSPAFQRYCLGLFHEGTSLDRMPNRVKKTHAEIEARLIQEFEIEAVACFSLCENDPDRSTDQFKKLQRKFHLKYRRLWHMANMAGDVAKVAVYDVIRHIYLIREKNGIPTPAIYGRPADKNFVPTLIEIADFVKEHPDFSLAHKEIYGPLAALAGYCRMNGDYEKLFEVLNLLYGGNLRIVLPSLLKTHGPETERVHLPLIITLVTLHYKSLKKDLNGEQAFEVSLDDCLYYLETFKHLEKLLAIYEDPAADYQSGYMSAQIALRKMCLEVLQHYFSQFDDVRDADLPGVQKKLDQCFFSQDVSLCMLEFFAQKVIDCHHDERAVGWKDALEAAAARFKTYLKDIESSVMTEEVENDDHQIGQLKWLTQMLHIELAVLEVAVNDYTNQPLVVLGLLAKIDSLFKKANKIYNAHPEVQNSFNFNPLKERFQNLNGLLRSS